MPLTTIVDLWADLETVWRRRGLAETLRWSKRTVLKSLVSQKEYTVFVRDLDIPFPAVSPGTPVKYRLAGPEDLILFQDESPSRRRRFELWHTRALCFIALHEDRLAAYSWATPEIDCELEPYAPAIPVRQGDSYYYDIHTLPAFRRQGIAMDLSVFRLRYMKQQGIKRELACVDMINNPSLSMHYKLDYRPMGQLSVQRILWKRYFTFAANSVSDNPSHSHFKVPTS